MSTDVSIHASAEVSRDAVVGSGTRIWHQVQIVGACVVGKQCVLGKGVYLGSNARVGDRVKVQNGAQVFGAVLEDEVMLAPNVLLLEDPSPRAVTSQGVLKIASDWIRKPVTIRRGATVGAGAIILPGITVGRWAMVGAGSVVHKDVSDYSLVVGNPARQTGYVCLCGRRLDAELVCGCGRVYADANGYVSPKQS